VPTIYLIALRIGAAVAGSLGWYWGLPQRERQAADARTRGHIQATYRAPLQGLSPGQARAAYDWARARHA
jgi:hypothetical protein